MTTSHTDPSAQRSSADVDVGQPTPFRIQVTQDKLERVVGQFANAHFPPRLGAGDWRLGTSDAFMHTFRDYLVNSYDWRRVEAAMNVYPQFQVRIDGHEVHYFHIKGEGLSPTPLILTHGWPGSVFEFVHLIEQLTEPSKFGLSPDDAFTVVIPSIPGFGWSRLADGKTLGPKSTADLWHTLMTRVLGYQRFGAQGGDLGSLISSQLAARHGQSVIGLHMNIVPWDWKPEDARSPEEQAWFDAGQAYQRAEFDYFFMQAQEPTVLGFALYDNPVGIAAWILDKVYAWSDHKGRNDANDDGTLSPQVLTHAISLDDLATFVMIYALTDTIATSIWWYQGIFSENGGIFHPTPGKKVEVPTGFAIFPKDVMNALPPRSWVEDQYNIVHWTDMARGGHFAAVEAPELFVADVRAFFRNLK